MHRALPSQLLDYLGPVLGGLVFIAFMSLLKQPTRRTFNAIFVSGAMGAYLGGGLGAWELPFAAAGSVVAFRGLRSSQFIGLAWAMHSVWDLVHHFYGNPIWPFLETSSFGCCLCDAVIAVWFFYGAPSIFEALRSRGRRRDVVPSGSEST